MPELTGSSLIFTMINHVFDTKSFYKSVLINHEKMNVYQRPHHVEFNQMLNCQSSKMQISNIEITLQWRHNERDSVLNHQSHDCLLNRLFRRRSKKTPKLRITGLCEGNSPVTGEFPTQRSSNAEKCFHLMTSSCRVWEMFIARVPFIDGN